MEIQEKSIRSCGRVKAKVVEIAEKTKKIRQHDPRRITYWAKVGLALTLVSSIYYFRPLFDCFGQAGLCAILTVADVFDYTVGGTLSRCLNRGFATLLAGALGLGAEYLATFYGEQREPVLLSILMFILVAAAKFTRLFPNIKRRFDYEVTIILTFSLMAKPDYQVDQIIQLAHQRLSTVLIGVTTCVAISTLICPVWTVQDLHNLPVENLEKLESFLEGFGDELFSFPGDGGSADASKNDKSSLEGYKSMLDAKATEESLGNSAVWVPGHGLFKFHHPCKQYLKIGDLAEECACHIEALSGYINSRAQVSSQFDRKIHQPCITISLDSGKVQKDFAAAIKNMINPRDAETHLKNSEGAA